jgi:hypothetical protein
VKKKLQYSNMRVSSSGYKMKVVGFIVLVCKEGAASCAGYLQMMLDAHAESVDEDAD